MQVILQGSLRHFRPGELLAFICTQARGGTLDLESAGRRTRIFCDGGHVVWAEGKEQRDVTETVLETFDWNSGTFTLLDQVVLPEGVRPVALEVPALLEEAARRAESLKYDPATRFRVVENPRQDISLTGDEFKLLFRIGPGKSFAELSAEFPDASPMLRKLAQNGLVLVDGAAAEVPRTTAARSAPLAGTLTPDGGAEVHLLLDPEYTIGRDKSNTIVIADGSVSSKHARIERTGDGFILEDLQSRNGSYVNGERITARRPLKDGDLVRLGKVILTFNLAAEAKAGDTTQPEVHLK
ncbi:MAG TPA: FHA domain-containing protein [Thermoanaerobaculia bacterium]